MLKVAASIILLFSCCHAACQITYGIISSTGTNLHFSKKSATPSFFYNIAWGGFVQSANENNNFNIGFSLLFGRTGYMYKLNNDNTLSYSNYSTAANLYTENRIFNEIYTSFGFCLQYNITEWLHLNSGNGTSLVQFENTFEDYENSLKVNKFNFGINAGCYKKIRGRVKIGCNLEYYVLKNLKENLPMSYNVNWAQQKEIQINPQLIKLNLLIAVYIK